MYTEQIHMMKAEYVTHYGTDLSVVNAARVSFASESNWEVTRGGLDITGEFLKVVAPSRQLSKKDAKLIKYLADHKHTSCFEHQGATLRIKVPIFIARQIHRHRMFSYNEVSRRYTTEDIEFYWPEMWRKAADNVKQGSSDEEAYYSGMFLPSVGHTFSPEDWAAHTLQMYNEMLVAGVAPEQARMILPQNMMTSFYMTGNLRSFENFLRLRLDTHSQLEIQEIAKQIEDILRPLWPVSMEALLPS